MSTAAASAPRGGLLEWVRLFRPHNAPLALAGGLAGLAAGWDSPSPGAVAVGVAIAGLGYGVGQTINDWFDREADAINAPERPLVSGAVNPHAAVAVAAAIMGAMFVAALAIVPAVAVWALVMVVGHAGYVATKGIPLLGNLVNGADVAVIVLIGAAAGGGDRAWHDVPGEALAVAGIAALGYTAFGMTSYFKDVRGDAAVGYRTIVVALGPQRARWVVPVFAVPAIAVAAVVALADPGALGGSAGPVFWVLLTLSAAGYALSLRDLAIAPEGRAYEALVWSTRATVLLPLALGAIPAPGAFVAITAVVVPLLELALWDTRRVRQA